MDKVDNVGACYAMQKQVGTHGKDATSMKQQSNWNREDFHRASFIWTADSCRSIVGVHSGDHERQIKEGSKSSLT